MSRLVRLAILCQWWLVLWAPGSAQTADGPALYQLHCAPCHGESGRGNGPAGRFLQPPPRDLVFGRHRFVSTANGVASDADLTRVLTEGLPGTAMLPFPHLSPEARQALVAEVRAFQRQGWRERLAGEAADAEELEAWVRAETTPGLPVPVPPPPPDTVAARYRGRLTYRQACVTCHGVDGRGIFNPDQATDEGDPVRPRDLTAGVLKGGSDPEALFVRIRCGLPGSPMPSAPSETLSDAAVWDLVHYLGALIPRGRQGLADARPQVLRVPRRPGPPPRDWDDPRFDGLPVLDTALAPFHAETGAPEGLTVRAFHDGEHIALRVVYPDPVRHPTADSPLPDGLAVRLTRVTDPPILPIPGQPLPLDRALFTSTTFPERDAPIYKPPFANPDNVCRAPTGPERVGTARWSQGVWTVCMVVAPERAGEIRPGGRMVLSLAVFDGGHRRGPLPVAFTHWHALDLE